MYIHFKYHSVYTFIQVPLICTFISNAIQTYTQLHANPIYIYFKYPLHSFQIPFIYSFILYLIQTFIHTMCLFILQIIHMYINFKCHSYTHSFKYHSYTNSYKIPFIYSFPTPFILFPPPSKSSILSHYWNASKARAARKRDKREKQTLHSWSRSHEAEAEPSHESRCINSQPIGRTLHNSCSPPIVWHAGFS